MALTATSGGLKNLPACMPIREEAMAFKAYCTAGVVAFRTGGSVSLTTYEQIEETISLFLGYVRLYHRAPDSAMSLRLFSNTRLWAGWIAYSIMRCHNTQGVINQISRSKRVVEYLLIRDVPNDEEKVSRWL